MIDERDAPCPACGCNCSTTEQCHRQQQRNESARQPAPEDWRKEANYQGAMADLAELLRVAIHNREGLDRFIADNYPENWKEKPAPEADEVDDSLPEAYYTAAADRAEYYRKKWQAAMRQPVVDRDEVICAINASLWTETEDDYQAEDIYNAIRPYLRQPRPKDEVIRDMADAANKVAPIVMDKGHITRMIQAAYEAEHGI